MGRQNRGDGGEADEKRDVRMGAALASMAGGRGECLGGGSDDATAEPSFSALPVVSRLSPVLSGGGREEVSPMACACCLEL